jgi:nitrite reductase/ring-hydroxylating ferredoxin subunit
MLLTQCSTGYTQLSDLNRHWLYETLAIICPLHDWGFDLPITIYVGF